MKTSNGSPIPLGVSQKKEVYNFAIFSAHAEEVYFLLFDAKGEKILNEIPLKAVNRTGQIWHIAIVGIDPNLLYAYRIKGPTNMVKGHLYDETKILSDPYAKELFSPRAWGAKRKEAWLSKIVTDTSFDWEDVPKPNIRWEDLVIYEMHVRGFTHHPSSKTEHPGTFLGVIEKIPYLKELGVTAVELMPIFEFDECSKKEPNPVTGAPLYNYWGYSPINFFSPMNRYASEKDPSSVRTQFCQMVKELHRNGIEVILDVVYNHTVEGELLDLYLNYKGIDNSVYYIWEEDGKYANYTGCGNTINANLSVVTKMILDSLRYWAVEMGVDGFRFDLASILTRDPHGSPLSLPPLIKWIGTDPFLSDVKLIAEPWDAAGLYQVGDFPAWGKWSEWNDQYRDSVRRFIKGTSGQASPFATALCASPNLYGKYKNTHHSINFITSHDGFTLRDLVTYQKKHNIENGEHNRDGMNSNENWNCGFEGITEIPEVNELRERQMRNFILALFSSQGVPMLLMGDEYGHTRKGNNNAWCQDDERNWFLWEDLKKNENFFQFVKKAIEFRQSNPLLKQTHFLSNMEIAWHGILPGKPNWSANKRLISFTLNDKEGSHLYFAFNSKEEPLEIQLPELHSPWNWFLIAATHSPAPEDFLEKAQNNPPLGTHILLPSYSALIAKALKQN